MILRTPQKFSRIEGKLRVQYCCCIKSIHQLTGLSVLWGNVQMCPSRLDKLYLLILNRAKNAALQHLFLLLCFIKEGWTVDKASGLFFGYMPPNKLRGLPGHRQLTYGMPSFSTGDGWRRRAAWEHIVLRKRRYNIHVCIPVKGIPNERKKSRFVRFVVNREKNHDS